MENIYNRRMKVGEYFIAKIVMVFPHKIVLERSGNRETCFLFASRYHSQKNEFLDIKKKLRRYDEVLVFCRKIRKKPIVQLWPPEDIDSYESLMLYIHNNPSIT